MIKVYVLEDTIAVEEWEVEVSSIAELDKVMRELERDYEDSLVSYFDGEIAVRVD